MKFESSAEIDAPLETVWEAIKDPEEWPQWIPSMKEIKIISKRPLGVGTQVRVIAKARITVKLLMTVTEFVPKQSVLMEGKVLCTRLTRYYTLEALSHKTRLTAGGEVSGLTALLIRRSGQALSDEIVQALKKKVES